VLSCIHHLRPTPPQVPAVVPVAGPSKPGPLAFIWEYQQYSGAESGTTDCIMSPGARRSLAFPHRLCHRGLPAFLSQASSQPEQLSTAKTQLAIHGGSFVATGSSRL
jgi:hypothetical protein